MDCDSLNGVFVNGVRVCGEVVLCEGDVVAVGCGELGFRVERIVVETERKVGDSFVVVVDRAKRLLSMCRSVLDSADPVSCLGQLHFCNSDLNDEDVDDSVVGAVDGEEFDVTKCLVVDGKEDLGNAHSLVEIEGQRLCSKIIDDDSIDCYTGNGNRKIFCPPPGKRFYLNCLKFMNFDSSGDHVSVSLPELLDPVESLSGIFIATFTSDIPW